MFNNKFGGIPMSSKKEQIVEACYKVMDGIENNTLSGNSAVLLCKKIARLSNDEDATKWLSYETGGYPRIKDGHISHEAWLVGASHGRKLIIDGKEIIFPDLIDEIETAIESISKGINNFSTSGASFNGDKSVMAAKTFEINVHNSVVSFIKDSKNLSKKRSILINEYYNYALKKEIEIEFESINETIFDKYQARVNVHISRLNKDLHEKLRAINHAVEIDNREAYSQALTSCRKLFKILADDLFAKVLPNYKDKTYKTKSNKEIDVSGDHTKNKLSAIVETITNKADKNTIVGSSILYLIDLFDSLGSSQSNGVHNDVNKETAEECIIQTYIALGKLLELYDVYNGQD